jgi:hypothetical protein
MDENEDPRNSNLQAEIAELRDKIADLEGQLAIAKSQITPFSTWYPVTSGAGTYTPNITFSAWTSGRNWAGT